MTKFQIDFKASATQRRMLESAIQGMFNHYCAERQKAGKELSVEEQGNELDTVDRVLEILSKNYFQTLAQGENAYQQTRIILQMLDQVSQRLRNITKENPALSFGEIVLASAMSATELVKNINETFNLFKNELNKLIDSKEWDPDFLRNPRINVEKLGDIDLIHLAGDHHEEISKLGEFDLFHISDKEQLGSRVARALAFTPQDELMAFQDGLKMTKNVSTKSGQAFFGVAINTTANIINDFSHVEVQMRVLENAVINLLDYYKHHIANAQEKQNARKDIDYTKSVLNRAKEVMLKNIDPEQERIDAINEKNDIRQKQAEAQKNKIPWENVDIKLKGRPEGSQLGFIMRMVDQISERLKRLAENKSASRSSFGEIVLASAIVASKASEELKNYNVYYINDRGKPTELYAHLFKEFQDNRIGLARLISAFKSLRRYSDWNDTTKPLYKIEWETKLLQFLNTLQHKIKKDPHYSLKTFEEEFEKFDSRVISADVVNYGKYFFLLNVLQMIEHDHMQALRFGKPDSSVDLPIDKQKLRERLQTAMEYIDPADRPALENGLGLLQPKSLPRTMFPFMEMSIALKEAIENMKTRPQVNHADKRRQRSKTIGLFVERKERVKAKEKQKKDNDKETDYLNLERPRKK